MILNEEGLIQTFMAQIRADMPNLDEQLTSIVAKSIKMNSEGVLSDEGALRVHQAAMDRRHRQAVAASNKDRIGFFAAKVGIIGDDGVEVTPEMALDDTRRRTQRYLGAVGSIPALFKSYFTQAELSVCSQIAIQCRHNGECRLSHGQLAYRARVSERTVRNTLAKFKALPMRLLEIKRRSRQPSIITVVSQAWRDWWTRSTPKTENKKPLEDINLDPPHPAETCRSDIFATPEPVVLEPVAVVEVKAVEQDLPKPVAPVRPTSIGHGPTTARKEAAPTLTETLNRVLSTVPLPPRETLDRKLDEWDRPMVSRACAQAIKPLLDRMAVVIELTGRGFAGTLHQGNKMKEATPAVLDWLESRIGRTRYGFRSYLGPAGRQIFVGFDRPEDAALFREAWGGV